VKGEAMRELSIWVLYDHPLDDPDLYVLRRWEMSGAEAIPTQQAFRSPDLDWLRAIARNMGLVCIPRAASDEPQIMESWL
jgi:hypothetical protein